MRRAAPVLLALLATLTLQAQDAPGDEGILLARAAAARRRGDLNAVRALLGDLVKRFPESPRAPRALLDLATTYDPDELDDRAAALKVLETLHRKFQDGPEARESESLVQQLGGAIFVRVATAIVAEHQGLYYWRGKRDSGFDVYRVPADLYQAAVDSVSVGSVTSLERVALTVPREAWTPVPSGIRSGDDDESLDWAREGLAPVLSAGILVVREHQGGFETRHVVRVQSFGLDVHVVGDRVLVHAAGVWTGEPVADLDVIVRTPSSRLVVRTGPDGLASFELASPAVLTAARDGDVEACAMDAPPGAPPSDLVHLATDRSIYGPGQTVSFKAVRRELRGGTLALPASEKALIQILDPAHRVLRSQELAWNDRGSLAGSLELADEPPLGEYSLVVRTGDRSWRRSFEVVAARRSAMRVSVSLRDAPGAKLRARVHAESTGGAPVAGGRVEWSLARSLLLQGDDTEPRPAPGDPRRWFYARGQDEGGGAAPDTAIASGTGSTDAAGDLEIEAAVPPTAPEDGSYAQDVSLTASVRGTSEVAASGAATIRESGSGLRVELWTPCYFYAPGEVMQPSVRVTRPDGKPDAGREVELVAFRSTWTRKGERELESFFSGKATTDERGVAVASVPLERGGAVRVRARVRDAAGVEREARIDLLVAGDDCARIPAEAIETKVVADRLVYDEGETARVLVLSPGSAWALLTVEGRSEIEARVVRLERPCEVIEVPLSAACSPNVFIKVAGCKEGEAFGGGVEVFAYPGARFMDVSLTMDKASYEPGEKARLSIATTSRDRGVPAEVELSVVDESTLSTRDSSQDIRAFFSPLAVTQDLEIGTLPLPPPTQSRGPSPGELGDTGAPTSPPPSSTLLHSARVVTGADGKTEVEFEIPRVFTAWRIEARAIAGELVGEARSRIRTHKDLTLRIAGPRFLTERDETTFGTIVCNDRPEELAVVVRLRVEGAAGESGERRVVVPGRGARVLEWRLQAQEPGLVRIHAEATSSAGSDSIDDEVPVREHGIERDRAAASRVDRAWKQTLTLPDGIPPSAASLEVIVTPGGLGAVPVALALLDRDPEGYVERTVSRFLPALAVSSAMKRSSSGIALDEKLSGRVSEGLQRLYACQHDDGGWGWWTSGKTDALATAHVVWGLAQARAAGVAVDVPALERGVACLRDLPASAAALCARACAGDDVKDLLGSFEPADAEDTAYLVLAGRRDLAAKLPLEPPSHRGAREIRRTALVVRALAAVDPHGSRAAALAEWLLTARHGPAWESTLDTAFVVQALAAATTVEEEPSVKIEVNGTEVTSRPGRVAVPASLLRPGDNVVEVRSEGGVAFASAVLRWVAKDEESAPERASLVVTRRFERRVARPGAEPFYEHVESGSEVAVGDDLRVTLTVRAVAEPVARVMVESPHASGTEALEPSDDTESPTELRDDRVCAPLERVETGETAIVYHVRPTTPGVYHVIPAVAWCVDDPGKRGTSGELLLRVVDRR